MKKYEMDLLHGSLWKKILIYSIPLMFTNILQVVFNMSDIAVVGKFVGPIALGAVGSTSILVTLFTGLLIGLASGVNALTALHIGSNNNKDVRETVHTAGILCLMAGIIIMALGIVFSRTILETMNTKDELIADAVLYLRIYLAGMPALALYNFGNAVLSAAGDTRRPLLYLFLAGVINVVLNLFFVIVCHLGVAGVAIASIIAQYISAVLILISLFKSLENFSLRMAYLGMNSGKLTRILRIGIPSAFQYALFAIANLFVQASVNSFDHVMVEGNAAAANADSLIYDMMAAFYTAAASFMAQNLGAHKRDRILKSYLISLAYSFFLGLILGISLYIFRYPFLSLFTSDNGVVEAGIRRLSIMSLSYAISAFMDCTIAASRGLGRTAVPTVIVIMGSCVFRIIWIYTVFAHFRTIESLYLLYACSWLVTAIAEAVYFAKIYRRIVPKKEDSDVLYLS